MSARLIGHVQGSDRDARSPITVCIICWNGLGVVENCIASVLPQTGPGDEILLIDDASTDGGPQLLAAHFPAVRILQQPTNAGPAAARNRGMVAARHDHVIFFDQDTVPEANCLAALSAALAGPFAPTLVMARMLHANAPALIQYDGANPHFTGLMTLQNRDRPVVDAPSEAREIGSIITSCFAVDRARWGSEPLLDEGYFFYLEDNDLGVRARQQGRRIAAEPAAACLHGLGTPDISLRATGQFTEIRVVYTIRNRWQLILKRFEFRTMLLLAPVLIAFEVAQLVGAVRNGWFAHWLTAARWILAHRLEIMAERRDSEQLRCCGDGLVLRGGPVPFHPRLNRGSLDHLAARMLNAIAALNWAVARPLLGHRSLVK